MGVRGGLLEVLGGCCWGFDDEEEKGVNELGFGYCLVNDFYDILLCGII